MFLFIVNMYFLLQQDQNLKNFKFHQNDSFIYALEQGT